jgi:uncharacterized protein YecE (DUF72 family)
MKFGKLENTQGVSFDLGPVSLYQDTKKNPSPRTAVCVGGTSWNQDFWRGTLFPLKSVKSRYKQLYGEKLDCIEFNTTYYRIPSIDQVKKWTESMPLDFKFCPKLFLGISRSTDKEEILNLTKAFLLSIQHFEDRLGPCFVQFPEKLSPKDFERVLSWLESWPKGLPLSMEFRNPSFFEDQLFDPKLSRLLADKGIGLVITDVEGRRDLAHGTYTSEFSLVRFVSSGNIEIDKKRLQDWKKRIEFLYKQYGILHYFIVHESETQPSGKLVQEALRILLNKFSPEEQLSLF